MTARHARDHQHKSKQQKKRRQKPPDVARAQRGARERTKDQRGCGGVERQTVERGEVERQRVTGYCANAHHQKGGQDDAEKCGESREHNGDRSAATDNLRSVPSRFLRLALPIYAAPVCRKNRPLKHVVDYVPLTKFSANQMMPANYSVA